MLMVTVCRCIDGYPRKITWLKCAYSNHSPGITASYFLHSVDNSSGYPTRLRTDCGTENVLIAAIQSFMSGSYAYGTSSGNQRIESWWSFYRRKYREWWTDLFSSLVASGSFHPRNVRATDCLRFCFMNLVQQDLDVVCRQWNTHRIRPTAGATYPAGVPDGLYYLPSPPATNRLRIGVQRLPAEVMEQVEEPRICDDAHFEEYLHYLCSYNHLSLPSDTESAARLYFYLLQYM